MLNGRADHSIGPSTVPPFKLVVIAASLGGLAAISTVLSSLATGFPAAVLVVQHLDPHHKTILDEILGWRTALKVSIAEDGAPVAPGAVMVAPPGRHLLVNAEGTVSLSDTARVQFVRPSADVCFESAAASYGERVIAVVLTGRGSDGEKGVQAIKRAGGTVIAQDEATSHTFGMPGAAIGTEIVDFVLPLIEIGPALIALTAVVDS